MNIGDIIIVIAGGIIVYKLGKAFYRITALRYETTRDLAKVVRKEYDDNFIYQVATESYPLGLFDEYRVYIVYNGKEYCFKNKDLYKEVHVGDLVNILIHKGYDKHGQLRYISLRIEE